MASQFIGHQDIKLTPEQEKAYDYIVKGYNVFLTGPSGTGKSSVIWKFKNTYGDVKKIAITSTTGISAILLGGTTIHSYLGIGLGQDSVDVLYDKILKYPKALSRWKNVDVLIIDEISMLSPVLFDKIEALGRMLRTPQRLTGTPIEQRPFGGIQLILTGDFLQLPVVGSDDFCFESESWEKCIDKTICLEQIMRQSDPIFQNTLNNLRFGIVSKADKKLLESRRDIELTNEYGIKPTVLHTTNASVEEINERELDNLARENPNLVFKEYNMDIYFYQYVKNKEEMIDKLRKSCPAPYKLQICEGAQVMLLCNLDIPNGLANGSRAVISGFIEDMPVCTFLNGEKRVIDYYHWELEEDRKKSVRISQIPLKVAYSITSHKSQGITLDYAEVYLDNVFCYGQSYVALSRIRTKEGLCIREIDYGKIQANPKAIDFYRKLEKEN